MIVTVNGREYRVRLRAAAWPHLRLLSSAFTDEVVDEEKLKTAEEKVLKYCVEGDVHPDDADEPFNSLSRDHRTLAHAS